MSVKIEWSLSWIIISVSLSDSNGPYHNLYIWYGPFYMADFIRAYFIPNGFGQFRISTVINFPNAEINNFRRKTNHHLFLLVLGKQFVVSNRLLHNDSGITLSTKSFYMQSFARNRHLKPILSRNFWQNVFNTSYLVFIYSISDHDRQQKSLARPYSHHLCPSYRLHRINLYNWVSQCSWL